MHIQYLDKIKSLKLQENKLKKLSKGCLYVKLIAFALMVSSVYLAFNQVNIINLTAVGVFLIAYLISYVSDDECKRKIDALRNMQKSM